MHVLPAAHHSPPPPPHTHTPPPRNARCRPRHWKALMAVTGHSFDLDPKTFTLGSMFAMQLHKFRDDIAKVTSAARKELTIESELKKLAATWQEQRFELHRYTSVSGVVGWTAACRAAPADGAGMLLICQHQQHARTRCACLAERRGARLGAQGRGGGQPAAGGHGPQPAVHGGQPTRAALCGRRARVGAAAVAHRGGAGGMCVQGTGPGGAALRQASARGVQQCTALA
jgi:hypothetical protein